MSSGPPSSTTFFSCTNRGGSSLFIASISLAILSAIYSFNARVMSEAGSATQLSVSETTLFAIARVLFGSGRDDSEICPESTKRTISELVDVS